MVFTHALLLFISAVFVYLVRIFISGFIRPRKFPPGPQWYPVFGNTSKLRVLSKKLGGQHHALSYLAKLYDTDVLGLKLGRELFVVVFTEPLLRHIYTDEAFQARPDNFFTRLRSMGTRKGITMTDGPFWKEQRAFAVSHLRELGFGKTFMETLIQDELQEMITRLGEGGEVCWANILSPSVLNVLWALTTGTRFAFNDQQLKNLLDLMDKRNEAFDISGGLLSQLPWLRHIAPGYTGYGLINKLNAQLSQLILDSIEEHKRTLSADKERDYIDAFLHEMSAAGDEHKSSTTFTEDQLIMMCLDFFIAGSQTTSNTLDFALLSVLVHPEVQRRVHEEIDAVLPIGKLPSVADRARFPYTEAVLWESQRYHYVIPVSGVRRAQYDTVIDGYIIPKGTTVLNHVQALHRDPEMWENPDEFHPERFLDEEGNFCPQQLYFFGFGKRRCIGETLARNFIFLFFIGLLRHFKLTPVPGKENPRMETMLGITLSPKPYSVYLNVR